MRTTAEVVIAALIAAAWYFAGKRLPKIRWSPRWVVLTAALFPVLIRLALLPWLPAPEPIIHDEFGHLLVADTLLSGRLANPPHPLARHFESIYILQHPAYASSYPPGQGMGLAAGRLIAGHPWAGVLLSSAGMCGAIAWMLLACLPAGWAALGALLAAAVYGLAPMWIDSYWGGSFCAMGGALLFGALLRMRAGRIWVVLGAVAGVGWSMVWLTRPFESVLLGVVTLALLARRRWIVPLSAMLAVEALTCGFTAVYNRAVTGEVTRVPYQQSQLLYGVPQSFLWKAPLPEPPNLNAEQKTMYWWQREVRQHAIDRGPLRLADYGSDAWTFFITPWLTLPLVLLWWRRSDRAVLAAVALVIAALIYSSWYPFFFPHYLAAYACVLMWLIVRGLMTLDGWRPWGRAAVLFLCAGAVLWGLRVVPPRALLGLPVPKPRPPLRTMAERHLATVPGRHVVLVRYGPTHNFFDEWVYNLANIDQQPIVWARAEGPEGDAEVLRYYPGRMFWIAEVDKGRARLRPYPGTPNPAPIWDIVRPESTR